MLNNITYQIYRILRFEKAKSFFNSPPRFLMKFLRMRLHWSLLTKENSGNITSIAKKYCTIESFFLFLQQNN